MTKDNISNYTKGYDTFLLLGENKKGGNEIFVTCDPGSLDGDYGCVTKYKRLPDGSIEIINTKYNFRGSRRKK